MINDEILRRQLRGQPSGSAPRIEGDFVVLGRVAIDTTWPSYEISGLRFSMSGNARFYKLLFSYPDASPSEGVALMFSEGSETQPDVLATWVAKEDAGVAENWIDDLNAAIKQSSTQRADSHE